MKLDRRTLLRGAGAALALPFLEAMWPSTARAASCADAASPLRLVWIYVPNGVNTAAWTPAVEGELATLPPTLEPLAPFRDRLLVLSGLTLATARANGDGPGDHARAGAAFLTCAQPLKADGAVRAGISVDQVAAQALGSRTRFRSLAIGAESGAQSGQCDSGYSCAYSSSLSWASERTPLAKETNPRALFDRLFRADQPGESELERDARLARTRSVLDLVRADAKTLSARLGAADRRKLDEYETAVREVERRLDRAAHGDALVPESARPAGIPTVYAEHLALLADVLVLALRTDSTRVATFGHANEGSNRSYASIEVPEGHHEVSHHGGDESKLAKVARIDRFHIERLAYLLAALGAAQEGDGDLLSRTLVVYGSGIHDGNRHDHGDLPLLVAGAVKGGRHLRTPAETPLANLHLAALQRAGIGAARFGDSTRALALG